MIINHISDKTNPLITDNTVVPCVFKIVQVLFTVFSSKLLQFVLVTRLTM